MTLARRYALPYGIWVTECGRMVLFNRFYEPIFERAADGTRKEADPTEWVKGVKEQRWFYADRPSESESVKHRKASAALAVWGAGGVP